MTFRDEGEISYALGKQGGTRRKWERGELQGELDRLHRKGVQILSCCGSLVCTSFLLLVAMPGAPSSVLAPSSKARSPY